MSLSAREKELIARHLLAHPAEIPVRLKQRKWEDLAALVEYASQDAPLSLAHTDPPLYRLLRDQITEFRLRGWTRFDLNVLRKLAAAQVS
jgi:hypothetical protein